MIAYKSTNVRTTSKGFGSGSERPLVPLSRLMARVEARAGAARVDVPDDWMQGRSVFGGLQAALALRAMRTLVPDVPLRALQTTFIAPVPGGRVEASARVLRGGKHVAQVEARIEEGSQTLALVVGVFGRARPSAAAIAPSQAEVGEQTGVELPFIPGVVPNFIQHFSARWLRGAPPFSGYVGADHVIRVELRDQARASEAHVLAIADVVPPLALAHLRAPAPASSATWLLEMLADRVDHLPLANWRVDGSLIAARDGYTSQAVTVWGPGGVPVALSRQTMLVFG